MAPRQVDAALALLHSADIMEQLRGLHSIKHLVIGNKPNKAYFLKNGVASIIVHLLQSNNLNYQDLVEVVTILGSLAHGNKNNVEIVINSGAINLLLNSNLDHYDLIRAVLRTIRILVQNARTTESITIPPHFIEKIKQIIVATESQELIESVAGIIARISINMNEENTIDLIVGIENHLLSYLNPECTNYRTQELVLDAFAFLSRDKPAVSKALVERDPKLIGNMQALLRHHRSSMRLLAATFLVNLIKNNCIPPKIEKDMKFRVLAILIDLFEDKSLLDNRISPNISNIQEAASLVYAYYITESDELQKVAMDANALTKLVTIVEESCAPYDSDKAKKEKLSKYVNHEKRNERKLETALLAIAASCSLGEECRKKVVDSKLLPHIIKSLSHSSMEVRAAACNCARSLSRSVKNLRTHLVDSGLTIPLIKLLSDESDHVKITAAATLCNIVLDFCPMKEAVIQNGGIEIFVSLAHSMDLNLRLNAVWAIKNLLYHASSEIKVKVMKELTWDGLNLLINDSDQQVRIQALNILRNLACDREEDIAFVMSGYGEANLVGLLNRVFSNHNESTAILLQALYIIVNVATGNVSNKTTIMNDGYVLQKIFECLNHSRSDIKVAALWAVINLTWPKDWSHNERVEILRNMGFESRLRSLEDDPDYEVRDRAKTAISHFQTGGGGGPFTEDISTDTPPEADEPGEYVALGSGISFGSE